MHVGNMACNIGYNYAQIQNLSDVWSLCSATKWLYKLKNGEKKSQLFKLELRQADGRFGIISAGVIPLPAVTVHIKGPQHQQISGHPEQRQLGRSKTKIM